jgi:hypothetical protein
MDAGGRATQEQLPKESDACGRQSISQNKFNQN